MPTKKAARLRKYLFILYLLITAVVIYIFARKFDYLAPTPPESTGIILEVSHIVPAGGEIRIKRKPAQQTKGCTVYTQRFLAPVGNKDLRTLVDEQIYVFDKNIDEVEFVFRIPKSIAPGNYIYTSHTHYYCSFFHQILGPKEYINKPTLIKITPQK